MNERITAVTAEYHGSQHVCHEVNEEVSLVAKFHKTLPHNNLGQVMSKTNRFWDGGRWYIPDEI